MFVCFQLSVSAQSIEFKEINKQGFSGLRTMNKDGYYVQFFQGTTKIDKERKQLFQILTLNNALENTSKINLELNMGDEIEDVSYNNNSFLVVYGNRFKNYRVFKIFDKEGKQTAEKKFENIPYKLFLKPAILSPVGSTDFLVINYIKEKKIGYSVERYNQQLEQQYITTETPDKQKLYPVDVVMSDNQLFVLEFLTRGYGDDFQYFISSYELATGKLIAKNAIVSPDGKAFGFATFLKSDNKGGVATGGMYFDEPETKKANSDGFFTAMVNASGKLTFSYVNWKLVADKLKDPNTSTLWGGKTKTFIHDLIINEDGSVTVIGENYRRGDATVAGEKGGSAIANLNKFSNTTGMGSSSEPTEEAVTVAEFAIMTFDKTGAFQGVRKIDKTNAIVIIKPTTNTENKPYAGMTKGLNLTNILNNRGYMPYRFSVTKNGKQYLAFWLKSDKQVKELLCFMPLEGGSRMDTTCLDVTGAELIYWQKLAASLNTGMLGKLNKLSKNLDGGDNAFETECIISASDDPNDYRSKASKVRVIPANTEGKVLIYDFIPAETPEGEKKGFFKQMEANANGSLTIWYMDIPTK